MTLILVLIGSHHFLFCIRNTNLGLEKGDYPSEVNQCSCWGKENPSEDSQFKYSHNKESGGSSCVCTSQITENKWSKTNHKTRTSLFYYEQNYTVDHPLSMWRRQPIKGPKAFVWKTDVADREEERDGGEGKADWLSPSMYLGAAKPCVILMSSAFCNLTWEFKSCLSFTSVMSAGSYISRKAKRRDWLVELQFLADVRCTSLPTINWDESASCRRKKRVIWQPSRHFTAIFLANEMLNGSLNSQMACTSVSVINRLLLLRDLFVSSTWYASRMSLINSDSGQQTQSARAW